MCFAMTFEGTAHRVRHPGQSKPAAPFGQDQHCLDRLSRGGDTAPAALGLEKRCNPFLRFDHPKVLQALAARPEGRPDDSRSAFRALRVWKDRG